jgi:mRNA interferase HicA
MTASELRRKLKGLGAEFEDATRHLKVTLNGKISFIPRHPSKEVKKGTLKGILKDLGIEKL